MPFDFLKLPAEIRDMIYHYHLTSERILPKYSFAMRWAPIDLLYVNRTVYNEAFFHLYSRGNFVFAVRPESIFALSSCWGTDGVSASDGLEWFVKSKKSWDLIRNIVLEIRWPSNGYAGLMDDNRCPSTDEMLKQTMTTVGAMLTRLPALCIIEVSWLQMTLWKWEVKEAAPPKYRIPGLLRGLKQVRRKNEKVLIRMPLEGPVSTEELAKDQGEKCELLNNSREMMEDHEEFLGSWKMVF